jgi:hypothetical protein
MKAVTLLAKVSELGWKIIPMFIKAAADGRITGQEIAEMIQVGADVLDISFDVDWADGWDDNAGTYKKVENV